MRETVENTDARRKTAENSAEILAEELNGLDIGIVTFPEIDSTNTEAKRRIRDGRIVRTTLFSAETQNAGRGRLGRTFYSPEGTGIYMTLAFRTHMPYSAALRMTGKASAAVLQGLEARINAFLQIKWVNDIMLSGRKIAGILTEALPDETNSFVEWLLFGVGINLTTDDFPEEIRDRAGSLGAYGIRKEELIGEIVRRLIDEAEAPEDNAYLEIYRNRSCVIGKEITYGTEGNMQPGTAESIDDAGRLIVRTPDGRLETLECGEVSVRVTNIQQKKQVEK